jgi:hypothetical protein
MKAHILLVAIPVLAGCGGPEGPEPGIDVDRAYAKGAVLLKTGENVAGQILLQGPGYLTVCFKIDSFEPGSSRLVRIEDVQAVLLEESLDDVDPLWKELQKEMTVMTGRSPVGDVRKAAPEG